MRGSSGTIIAACAAALALACADRDAQGRAADGRAPVVVIAIDGLRFDHTSLRAGQERDTTPFLARFARESCAVVTPAWAPHPSLEGSHVALLSGCDPRLAQPPPVAGDASPGWVVPSRLDLVSRRFLGEGWKTAAFFDSPRLADVRGIGAGFRQVFDPGSFYEDAEDPGAVSPALGAFVTWMGEEEQRGGPWFAYVQVGVLEGAFRDEPRFLGEPEEIARATAHWTPRPELSRCPPVGDAEPALHSVPPSRASRAGPTSLAEYDLRYDRGLLALDGALGEVVRLVDEAFGEGRVTVVIVGASGMQLGEWGHYLGAGMARAEDLVVPLLVRPGSGVGDEPLRRTAGSRDLVATLDLAPTLLDLHTGLGGAHGHGIALTGGPPRTRVFLAAGFGDEVGVATGDALAVGPGQEPEVLSTPGGAAGEAPGAQLVTRWGRLLLERRRQLHFGAPRTDTRGAEEFIELQTAVP